MLLLQFFGVTLACIGESFAGGCPHGYCPNIRYHDPQSYPHCMWWDHPRWDGASPGAAPAPLSSPGAIT